MIRLTFSIACALAFAPLASAEDVYDIDPVHSQPMYEIQHMGFSLQRGSFTRETGKVTLDRAGKKGSIEVTIDTTSIRSIDPRLDTHLKGEDFFDVARYPSMTFKSTKLVFDGDKVVGAEGELTLKGITHPVSLKVANFVCGNHPLSHKPMCGAEATTTIKRSQWGMTYGLPGALGDEVKITIPVEAYRQ